MAEQTDGIHYHIAIAYIAFLIISVSFHTSNTSSPSENTIHLRKLPPATLHTLFLVVLSQVFSKQVSNYTTEEYKMTRAQVAFPGHRAVLATGFPSLHVSEDHLPKLFV